MMVVRSGALSLSLMVLAAPTLLAAVAPPAIAPHLCDPYPIGRCGDFQREAVIHCYLMVAGQYRSPTDPHVVTLGGAPPNVVAVDQVVAGQLYLRLGPSETLVNDPYDAPLPYKSLYREDNSVAGLQPLKYKCATFVWFAECEPAQWMGPVAPFEKDPDEVVL